MTAGSLIYVAETEEAAQRQIPTKEQMSKLAHSNDVTAFQIMIDRMKENEEMPRQFRKKPVVIEAVHFDGSGDACTELSMFTGGFQIINGPVLWNTNTNSGGKIRTLEGDMDFRPGDWIIKGVKGEFYPCKADIFAATYEPVI